MRGRRGVWMESQCLPGIRFYNDAIFGTEMIVLARSSFQIASVGS